MISLPFFLIKLFTTQEIFLKGKIVKAEDRSNVSPIKMLKIDNVIFHLKHQIGVGASSTVYKAEDEWGNALVVKIYNKNIDANLWKNEIRQLKQFSSPWVPYVHGVFVHNNLTYVLMEDAGVPIFRYTFKDKILSYKVMYYVAARLLNILNRIHSKNFFHGDVSPQNVLIQIDKNKRITSIKLVDFALCRSEQALKDGQLGMAIWTPPPEYLKKSKLLIGSAFDVWHAAILFMQILKAEVLDYSLKDILNNKPRKDITTIESPYSDVIYSALSPDPKDRPSALDFWRSIQLAHNKYFSLTNLKK